jgi:hypothetical protein
MIQEHNNNPTKQDLIEMNQKILALKEKAKQSKADAKDSFGTQIRALEDQYDVIAARMDKATKKAGAVGSEVSEGISKAWKDLTDSFAKAKAQLH